MTSGRSHFLASIVIFFMECYYSCREYIDKQAKNDSMAEDTDQEVLNFYNMVSGIILLIAEAFRKTEFVRKGALHYLWTSKFCRFLKLNFRVILSPI